MNRRNFLSLFSAGVAGIALEQAIPLGRVWSFPKEIVIPPERAMHVDDFFERAFPVGSMGHFRFPARFAAFDYSYAAIRANGWNFPSSASAPSAPGLPAGPVEIGPRLATRRNS